MGGPYLRRYSHDVISYLVTGTQRGLSGCQTGIPPLGARVMDTTTLLIILVVILLLGGGGWYGRGRWY